jgi:hypothetical protein
VRCGRSDLALPPHSQDRKQGHPARGLDPVPHTALYSNTMIITKAASLQLFRANNCTTTAADIAQSIQQTYPRSPRAHQLEPIELPASHHAHQGFEFPMVFYQGNVKPYNDSLFLTKLQELTSLLQCTTTTVEDRAYLTACLQIYQEQASSPLICTTE